MFHCLLVLAALTDFERTEEVSEKLKSLSWSSLLFLFSPSASSLGDFLTFFGGGEFFSSFGILSSDWNFELRSEF